MNPEKIIREAFNRSGCRLMTVVAERPDVWDFGVDVLGPSAAIVRSVSEAGAQDYLQLETMLAQGTFNRAYLVHAGEAADLTSQIQTWPLSRIDELAALLANEKVEP